MTVKDFLNVFDTDDIVLFSVNGKAVLDIFEYSNMQIKKVSIYYTHKIMSKDEILYEDYTMPTDKIKLPKNCFRVILSLNFTL